MQADACTWPSSGQQEGRGIVAGVSDACNSDARMPSVQVHLPLATACCRLQLLTTSPASSLAVGSWCVLTVSVSWTVRGVPAGSVPRVRRTTRDAAHPSPPRSASASSAGPQPALPCSPGPTVPTTACASVRPAARASVCPSASARLPHTATPWLPSQGVNARLPVPTGAACSAGCGCCRSSRLLPGWRSQ